MSAVQVIVYVQGEGSHEFSVPSGRLGHASDPVAAGLGYAAEKHSERVLRNATEADLGPRPTA